ncbi:GntR family transcriptional regulator [Kosmotoga arenicorallina S304]|uniref:GntR family transcriptional regulator n=1 Tax=Kosmotoga arenicorallina S304 TaxID=1453497 RepID=A0A176K1F2_9BACT|nr:GntR family transcriptional regulator [Kosmotoga arenicorallina]OAA30703.1 GntR family transcriptional regulator [Kosmotoga arenicorallina S304]
MLLNLDLRSSMPIYEQIKLGILGKILNGELKRDDVLPSIRELASILRVNPNTVIRAYKELEIEGILIARQGIGFLVNAEIQTTRGIFMAVLQKELLEPIRKAKRSGIELEEIIEVVKELWKNTE